MKYSFILYFAFLSNLVFSQAWLNSNPTDNLSNYQNSFETYWSNKNIRNGYYIENGIEKKAYGWKQFKRWEHYWSTRVNKETGDFPTLQQYKIANAQYKISLNTNRSLTGEWVNLGPSSSAGGYAGVGRISEIKFHPSDNNTFWVGTPSGGLWETTNNGSSWTVLTDQNEVLGVSAIAIPSDYESSQTIYIGTGDKDGWRHDNGNGILKSTDGGINWTQSLAFSVSYNRTVNKIIIHPSNNNIIYAAVTDGIYKSTNAGDTWSKIYSSYYISDLEFKPNDPSIIYASNKRTGKIYKLTNDGANTAIVYSNSDAKRIELAVSNDNPNIVYAIAGNSDSGLLGFYKSTDSGDSYILVSNSPNILSSESTGSGTSGQSWYDLALIADPNNANIIYAGGINTWKSTNGGQDWSIQNHWSGSGGNPEVHADKHCFAFNNGLLYEGNDGGLYTSTNGDSWTDISNGIINSQMYRLAVSQTESNHTITGLQDNGTKELRSNGNWYDVVGGDGMNCEIDPSNSDIMYGSYQYGNIKRTTNGWSSTTRITTNTSGSPIHGLTETGDWITPFIINPNNTQELFIGLENVWKSTNRGDSWTKISDINASDKLTSIAISKSNSQVIYTTDETNLWVTNNQGNSWTEISSGLPNYDITSILIKDNDPNTIWVTLGSFNSSVIYTSTNQGTDWTNISSGLPNIPGNIVIQNTQNTAETELYIGTDYGVYIKIGNNDWELFNTGMPKVTICDLDIYYDNNPNNSIIRAATWGRGLWESNLYSLPTSTPIAEFTANITNISEGESIIFSDLSSNNPSDWLWDFGDETTSSEQNPTHIFNAPGIYSISLTASNTEGSDTETKTEYITVNSGTDISIAISSGSDDVEEFNSNGYIYANSSDLELCYDAGESEHQNIGLRFQDVNVPQGSIISNAYIKFRADESDNSNINILIKGVDEDNASAWSSDNYDVSTRNTTEAFANWNFNSSSAWTSDNTISQSIDLSEIIQEIVNRDGWTSGNAISFVLSDNGTDTDKRVADSYEGNYPATLNFNWSEDLTPIADFTGTPLTICPEESVSFLDASTNSPISWSWDFGDETNIITLQNPSHTYSNPGTYNVSLTVSNNQGSNTKTISNYVVVNPTTTITSNPSTLIKCEGEEATFTIQATGSNLNYQWQKNNSNISGANTPTYTISNTIPNNAGGYKCIVSGDCSTLASNTASLMVNPLPVANFTINTSNEPFINFTNNSSNGTSFLWNLGDGTTETSTDVTHEYTSNGSYTIILSATNNCGTESNQQSISITNIGISSIDNSNIKIYPTPTESVLNIDLPQNNYKIQLIDIDGKILRTTESNMKTNCQLNIEDLKPGIYQLLILDPSNKKIAIKIIKR